ncbi:hypothetical protein PANT_15d00051 [Moesziomyces antarcticus T-34]|uniref:Uncharacterized protein n=1 Tax=Pseudozyma antarctica (strain T-34) TaxID=1151754 RepID=M9LXN9_PSEA3|nr:hypothetical protein PANT_15d00051 [Moesziomyces antarcticus T-34]
MSDATQRQAASPSTGVSGSRSPSEDDALLQPTSSRRPTRRAAARGRESLRRMYAATSEIEVIDSVGRHATAKPSPEGEEYWLQEEHTAAVSISSGNEDDISRADEEEEIPDSEAPRSTKRKRKTGKKPTGRPRFRTPRREEAYASDTLEEAVSMAYVLRVGPALQHAATGTIGWSAQQVKQDIALLLNCLLRLKLAGGAPNVSNDARRSALALAETIERRYIGTNDITSIGQPYAYFRKLWLQLQEDPATSQMAAANSSSAQRGQS